MEKNFSIHKVYEERKRNEEEYLSRNKRKIIEMQDKRKWNLALHKTEYFSLQHVD